MLFLFLSLSTLQAAAQTRSTDAFTPIGLSPSVPSASRSLSGFDHINIFNGNLRFALPLMTVGGRGGARHTPTLSINTRWTVRHSLTDPVNEIYSHVPEEDWWSGFHLARYTPGRLIARPSNDGACGAPGAQVTGTEMRLTFIGPDGSELDLLDAISGGAVLTSYCGSSVGASRGAVFVSYDGSGVTFVSDATIYDYIPPVTGRYLTYPSGYLLFRDGTRYRIFHGKVMWTRDRNGNLITFDYDDPTRPSGRLIKITDSLRREVNITHQTAQNGAPISEELTYKGFNGTGRTIRVEYDNLGDALRQGPNGYTPKTATDLFGLDNGNYTHDPTVISSVVLPDGVSRYRFYYNSHGELARVVLPTGGAYEYDWGPSLAGGADTGVVTVQTTVGGAVRAFPEIYRRVLTGRVMTAAGAIEGVTTFSQTQGQGTASVTVAVDHKKANGVILDSREKHYFHGNPVPSNESDALGLEPWKAGREYQTEVYDSDGQTPLRLITQEWELGQHPNVAYDNVPRVKETATTLSDSNQTSRVTYSYDQYNNVTDVYEYGYDGALLRRIHADYETAAGYTNAVGGPHLRSLSKGQWVSTDADGLNKVARTVYAYDQYDLTGRANITGICTYFSGNVCSTTGPNGEPSTGYTTRGNVTGVTRYADAAVPAGAVTVASRYDIAGNVVSTTDARNQTSAVTYGDGVCVGPSCGTPSVNTFAFPVSAKTPKPDPDGTYGSALELTSSAVYDFYTGLVRSTTDANNQTTTRDYHDAQGNLDPRDRLRAVVRPDGGRTDYEYGDEPGNLYARTLADLDGTRRLKSEQHFDGMGRVYRSFTWEGQDAANPWLTADTLYDSLGRAWRTSDQYRSTGPGSAVNEGRAGTETTFDALGRVTQVKTTADGATVHTAYKGDRTLVTDQAGRQRISQTDAFGRLREVWEVTPNDPVKYPDIESIPSAVTAGLLASAHGYRTEYFYDAVGNLRRAQQGGQARFFAYDSLGRLVRAKNPEQGAFTPDGAGGDFPALSDATSGVSNGQWSLGYVYDANGNLAKRRDARGTTTTYAYDALNRNILVAYSDGTPGVKRVYDTAVNGRGRYRGDWTWDGNSTHYTHRAVDSYDAAGRPLDSRQYFYTNNAAGSAFTTSRTYNLAGAVTSERYPSGHSVSYGYDAAGRLADFAGDLGDGATRAYASGITYGVFGGIQEERFGTDTPLYHKLHYNRRGQLYDLRLSTVAWATDQWNWNRGAIVNYYSSNYAWEGDPNTPAAADNNGNVLRQQHWAPADDAVSGHAYTQQTFDYDSLNRLRSVSELHGGPLGQSGQDFAQAYAYDRWGNRTIDAQGTWLGEASAPPSALVNETQFDKTEAAATNRLYAPGDTDLPMAERRIRYDAAGNLTYDGYMGAGARSYDAEGRMFSARVSDTQAASYGYDADGRRVRRNTGAGEVWQVYGLGGELLAEYDAGTSPSSPRKEYGYRGGELLVTAAPGGGGWGPAPAFTGPNPLRRGDPIKLEHLTDLRGAVNQLRQRAGLAAYAFTVDPEPMRNVTKVKADHIRQLRAALEEARSRLGLSVGGYAHPTLTEQVSLIYAVDFQELREQVRGAWQGGGGGVDVRWLVSDQLGTPRMVVDKTGSLAGVARHDYLPFGEEVGAGVGGRTTTQGYGGVDNVRQKFTSYERDGETILDYAQARYYSSTLGRFTSPDEPLMDQWTKNPQSWNLYSFVRNNPLRLTDPTGRMVQDPVHPSCKDASCRPDEDYVPMLEVDNETPAAVINQYYDDRYIPRTMDSCGWDIGCGVWVVGEFFGIRDPTFYLMPGSHAATGLILNSTRAGVSSTGVSNTVKQVHHFATNKSSTYTAAMEEIAGRYGLSLDGAWNKELLPHLGRHPNEYHDFVLDGMKRASSEAGGNPDKFIKLFEKYVKEPVRQNPELLRKSGWQP